MKKLLVASFTIIAFSILCTGCEDGGTEQNQDGTPAASQKRDIAETTISSKYGLNPELGTPPPIPGN